MASVASGDTLEAEGATVTFPAVARPKADRIVETFRWRREDASRWLGVDPPGRADIHLVPDLASARSLAPGTPSWAVAVTSGSRMVFRLDIVDHDPTNSLDLVLRHEMVHFVLRGMPVGLPRWFEEGLAVHHAGLAYLEPDARLERFAAAGNLPRFAEADLLFAGDAPEAALGYKLGERVVAAFVARFGDEAVRRVVARVAGGEPFPGAFEGATGVSLDAFERQWREEVTPALPFWLFLILENSELSLLCAAAILAVLGYLRWRLRRERAMAGLGGGP